MVAARFATAVKEGYPDEEQPGTRVEQELRDIVQRTEHASAIVQIESPGWYYCMPYPGVRYYCHETWPPPLTRSARSLNDAPAGG